MAKKDVLTIDTARASDGLKVFESKKKSFTTAYNAYQGSYLNTCGDSTVRKLNNTVKGIYSAINSLYASLNSYTASYIKSVQSLEESLRNGLIPPEEESDVKAKIAAVNEILNGANPTDIEIDPRTGEVIVDKFGNKKYYGGAWDGATVAERFMSRPDPSKISSITGMNMSRNGQEVIEANADRLTHAYIAHPKLTSFVQGLAPTSLETIFSVKYNDRQLEKVTKIKGDNVGWETAGTIAGFVLAGGGIKGALKGGRALGAGAKILGSEGLSKGLGTIAGRIAAKGLSKETPEIAIKGAQKIGLKEALKFGAKETLIENVRILPLTHGYSLRDSYDIESGKVNAKKYGLSMLGNILTDLGVMGLGKLGMKGLKSIKKSSFIKFDISPETTIMGKIRNALDDQSAYSRVNSIDRNIFHWNNYEISMGADNYSVLNKIYYIASTGDYAPLRSLPKELADNLSKVSPQEFNNYIKEYNDLVTGKWISTDLPRILHDNFSDYGTKKAMQSAANRVQILDDKSFIDLYIQKYGKHPGLIAGFNDDSGTYMRLQLDLSYQKEAIIHECIHELSRTPIYQQNGLMYKWSGLKVQYETRPGFWVNRYTGLNEATTEYFNWSSFKRGRNPVEELGGYRRGVRGIKDILNLNIKGLGQKDLKKAYFNHDISLISGPIDKIMGNGYFENYVVPAFDDATLHSDTTNLDIVIKNLALRK